MTRSGTLAASCISLAALLMAALPLRAQSPEMAPLRQPESIPFELAAALSSAGGMSGEPQILVGSVPGWVSDRIVVPPNARILGSAFYGTNAVVILTTMSADDSLMADLRRELMKHGWLTPPPLPNYGGGFRQAIVTRNPSNRISLCGEGRSLNASIAKRQGSTSNITLRIASATQNGTCNPPQLPPGYPRESIMPTLYHPEGLTEGRTAAECVQQMHSSGTSALLRSTMTPDALVEHYSRQLKDSGWVAAPLPTIMSARTFARVDSAGVKHELTLSVSTAGSDNSCRSIKMDVSGNRIP